MITKNNMSSVEISIPSKILNLFSYRNLIYCLAIKDLKVKYKSAVLGFLWALIVPVVIMLVFLFIFSFILQFKKLTVTYLLTALFPWTFFSNSIFSSTTSIVDNSSLIKRNYFPREIIPVSIIFSNLFNFFLSLIILFFVAVLSGYTISWTIIFLPYVVLLQFLLVIGISLLCSSLFVHYRDIKYIVEIMMLIWFYLTPIFYDQKIIRNASETLFKIYLINPMTGLIVMYRDIFMYHGFSSPKLVLFTSFLIFIIFYTGYKVFLHFEPEFADFA